VTLALHLGDCLDVLRTLPDCSVDAVVTDPPYGLSFMGKKWDYDVPSVAIWAECLRVLKPGGHLLAFAGTRTQHRMAVRIEDAGFEIRDMIAWVYGSGFPKSLDVSKAIDKAAGAEREVTGSKLGQAGYSMADNGRTNAVYGNLHDPNAECAITAPATPEAQQWAGWGTALKPALEPITMARKPLAGTVAANVLEHGTGALNVDGCRVGAEARPVMVRTETVVSATSMSGQSTGATSSGELTTSGRWPSNLIHDGSDEVVGLFPSPHGAGYATDGKHCPGKQPSGASHGGIYGDYNPTATHRFGDTGSAARFFYTAKASKDDRDDGNTHPTVKPTDLMRHLCRLVTPPGGVVLDPFMGSGSTGKAAMLEGFGFIGIERELAYHAIAERRIRQAGAAGYQPDLFSSGCAA
jgi:site-specific DNA-methyltransferase (adenine-specific)